jgi:hypothetical protein
MLCTDCSADRAGVQPQEGVARSWHQLAVLVLSRLRQHRSTPASWSCFKASGTWCVGTATPVTMLMYMCCQYYALIRWPEQYLQSKVCTRAEHLTYYHRGLLQARHHHLLPGSCVGARWIQENDCSGESLPEDVSPPDRARSSPAARFGFTAQCRFAALPERILCINPKNDACCSSSFHKVACHLRARSSRLSSQACSMLNDAGEMTAKRAAMITCAASLHCIPAVCDIGMWSWQLLLPQVQYEHSRARTRSRCCNTRELSRRNANPRHACVSSWQFARNSLRRGVLCNDSQRSDVWAPARSLPLRSSIVICETSNSLA